MRPRCTAGLCEISFAYRQIGVGVCLQELGCVIGMAVQNRAVPWVDCHIGNCVLVATDVSVVSKPLIKQVELPFNFHRVAVNGVFDLHRRVGIEVTKSAS